ncbi:hypothetical protein HanRHA438_Chr09g0386291 [Helianthus annuus]|nr:hypothetical protein HanHA89_Chr09g0328101 [Helianthus annuus]KAJ0706486.1 hypothetical protein HanLR1_Chr09g0307581 [Helianthus annuus]KAJ0887043.1 hypothetical protein HanRHA438_Chr09g0386291 [Helianthus annuus]
MHYLREVTQREVSHGHALGPHGRAFPSKSMHWLVHCQRSRRRRYCTVVRLGCTAMCQLQVQSNVQNSSESVL